MHDCLLLKSARRWWGGARTIKGPQIDGGVLCMRYGEIYKHACMETTAARPQRSRHCIHHTDSSQFLILSRAPSLLSRARGNPVLHCRTLVSTPLYPPAPGTTHHTCRRRGSGFARACTRTQAWGRRRGSNA